MDTYVLNNPGMKKETVMAYAGAVLLAIAFIFTNKIIKDSSPFALFIFSIVGLLAAGKYRLLGGALLFFLWPCISGSSVYVYIIFMVIARSGAGKHIRVYIFN